MKENDKIGESEASEIKKKHTYSEVKNPIDVVHRAIADLLSPEDPEWDRILSLHGKYAAQAIKRGRLAAVPEVLIQRYAFEIIAKHVELQDYAFIVRFMKNMDVGTPDLQLYFEGLEKKKQEVMTTEKTQQKSPQPEAKKKQRRYLLLSPDATIADLVTELNSASVAEDVNDLFFTELADNLSNELGPKLIEIMHTEEAARIKVVDFFDAAPESLAIDLPIKFRTTGKWRGQKK
ncbi:MAG: hypothetical protein Q7R81_04450 [Candidatus Peregrinibacteria bacterium]|nr:hypothetical protein [Candidatus Peregrinibacteria bacterium]